MRIGMAIEHFDPSGGGAERSTAQIATELARRGHEVTIVAGAAPQELELDGVRVQAMGTAKPRSLPAIWRFRQWAIGQLRTGGYDATLSVTLTVPAMVLQPRSGVYREVIARNAAKRSASSVGQAMGRAAAWLSPKKLGLLRMEAMTLHDPAVRHLAPVSRYGHDQLLRHHDVHLDRMTVIHNAAAMPAIDPTQRLAWRRELREGFGLDDATPVFLFAALNPLLKGLVPLIHAMAELRERRVAANLLVVGCVAWRYQALAEELGVRDRLRFTGPTDQMPAFYSAADVTVLPSFFDPSSKVVIESLMLGIPAITTVHNGASDHILGDIPGDERAGAGEGVGNGDDGPSPAVRGRVIPDARDVVALADAMENLSDPDERARCADATAGLADALSMGRHVDRLETLLVSVAGR